MYSQFFIFFLFFGFLKELQSVKPFRYPENAKEFRPNAIKYLQKVKLKQNKKCLSWPFVFPKYSQVC